MEHRLGDLADVTLATAGDVHPSRLLMASDPDDRPFVLMITPEPDDELPQL